MENIAQYEHEAMHTHFRILIAGEKESYTRTAVFESFRALDLIEGNLSRFVPSSDVTRINRLGDKEWVPVSLETFECLKIAARVSADTKGAFDLTVGPLLQLYKKEADAASPPCPSDEELRRTPSPAELAEALRRVGMKKVILDEDKVAVRLEESGMLLNLGGIGKGYAIEVVLRVLRDYSISAALVQGGDSTAYALGSQPGEDGWPISVGGDNVLGTEPVRMFLNNRSVSGSGIELQGAHIIDPRTGRPARAAVHTWSFHESPAVADALSTAFMVMGADETRAYCREHSDTQALLLVGDKTSYENIACPADFLPSFHRPLPRH